MFTNPKNVQWIRCYNLSYQHMSGGPLVKNVSNWQVPLSPQILSCSLSFLHTYTHVHTCAGTVIGGLVCTTIIVVSVRISIHTHTHKHTQTHWFMLKIDVTLQTAARASNTTFSDFVYQAISFYWSLFVCSICRQLYCIEKLCMIVKSSFKWSWCVFTNEPNKLQKSKHGCHRLLHGWISVKRITSQNLWPRINLKSL